MSNRGEPSAEDRHGARDRHDQGQHEPGWGDMVRLASVVSAFSAAAAAVLAGRVPETAIVVGVIVLATMVSWFHIERPPFGHRRL